MQVICVITFEDRLVFNLHSMNLRHILKTHTASTHQALDDFIAEMDVFSSPNKYRLYLNGMHFLYQAYGQFVDQASVAAGLDPAVSNLLAAIECDVGDSTIDQRHDSRIAKSDATTWAVGYVLEGSAMGARYMVKAARSLNEQHPETFIGCDYLETLSTDSYHRWPKYVDSLNQIQCDPAIAVSAANEVFDFARQTYQQLSGEFLATEAN